MEAFQLHAPEFLSLFLHSIMENEMGKVLTSPFQSAWKLLDSFFISRSEEISLLVRCSFIYEKAYELSRVSVMFFLRCFSGLIHSEWNPCTGRAAIRDVT